jgi:putative YhdH/YhfP family quinone oxidoreductase
MPTTFRALWIEEAPSGGVTRRIIERSTEDLPSGDLLIRVQYSSLNYKDALSASGNRGVTRHYPHTPGIDAAGVVEESTSPAFRPGDSVLVASLDMGVSIPGGFGGYVRVPAAQALPLPVDLTPRAAMTYGTAGFTAAMCVDRLIQAGVIPEAGEILVTGATGGVGTVAIGILAREGYRAIAATGKRDQGERLMALGAASVIDRSAVIDESPRPLLHGRWAGVVDTVGGSYLSSAIRASLPGGVVTACGNAASPELSLTVYPFILRGISLHGIDATLPKKPERIRLWNKLAKEWRIDLEPYVREVSLDGLGAEIDKMLKGSALGRVVVKVSG